jgi:acyl-CoA thioesterase-1
MRYTRRTVSLLSSGGRVRIVAFGDSITQGYAVAHGFPYFWKRLLQARYKSATIEMQNEGISGDTTLDGLSRLPYSVIQFMPDLVTINFGINDAAYGITLQEFRDNLYTMVDRVIADCGSEVLLLSSQPLLTPHFDRLVMTYYRAIEEVAQEADVGYVDVFGAWMRHVKEETPLEAFIISGLDHPNEEGYKIIAEELMSHF